MDDTEHTRLDAYRDLTPSAKKLFMIGLFWRQLILLVPGTLMLCYFFPTIKPAAINSRMAVSHVIDFASILHLLEALGISVWCLGASFAALYWAVRSTFGPYRIAFVGTYELMAKSKMPKAGILASAQGERK